MLTEKVCIISAFEVSLSSYYSVLKTDRTNNLLIIKPSNNNNQPKTLAIKLRKIPVYGFKVRQFYLSEYTLHLPNLGSLLFGVMRKVMQKQTNLALKRY